MMLSLRARFFVAILLLLLLAGFALFHLNYRSNMKWFHETSQQQMQTLYLLGHQQFQNGVQFPLHHVIDQLSTAPAIWHYFELKPQQRRLQRYSIEQFLQSITQKNGQLIRSISLFDHQGRELLGVIGSKRLRRGFRQLLQDDTDTPSATLYRKLQQMQIRPNQSSEHLHYSKSKHVSLLGIPLFDPDFDNFHGGLIIEFIVQPFYDALDELTVFGMSALWVLDQDYNVLHQPENVQLNHLTAGSQPNFWRRNDVSLRIIRPLTQHDNFQQRYLAVFLPETVLRKQIDDTKYNFFLLMVPVIIILILILFYFNRHLYRPLAAIAKSTRAIARGELRQEPLPIQGHNEISYLSHTFNTMLRNLDETAAIADKIAEGDLSDSDITERIPGVLGEDLDRMRSNMKSKISQLEQSQQILEKYNLSIREQQQYLQRIIDALPYPLYVIDVTDYSINLANRAAGADVTGKTCHMVSHHTQRPCDSSDHSCPMQEVIRTGEEYRTEHTHYDSLGIARTYMVNGLPIKDSEGRVVQMIELSIDITERITAENKIKAALEEIHVLLESTSDGIYAIDREGVCIIFNSAAAHMLGYQAPDQVIGKNAHTLFHHSHPDGSEYPEDDCVMNKGLEEKVMLPDEIFWRADGSSIPVACRIAPMKRNKEIVGSVVSFTDMTERRATELQLRQAQKLESIGQLAAGIAHEINTPTQFVGDNTTFLCEAFEDYKELMEAYEGLRRAASTGEVSEGQLNAIDELVEEKEIEYLNDEIPKAIKQSQEGLTRIATIVRAMKEFSHPGTEEKTATDLNRAIKTTINVSRNEWKYCAELITKLDPLLPQVPALANEFNQVILNLIVNASHAITDVVGSTGKMGEIRIATRLDGERAEITISDTGKGIPAAIKKRIFDPFFTTKEVGKGSGQGLAIAWSVIVDKHGGTIRVESEVGKGTTFTIRLPI